MSYFRTALLLAGLTALFMGVGYLIGGGTGAVIALGIAAATNLFAYWNSDRMVLSMYGAHEVDRSTAPDLVDLVAGLAARAQLPMPRVFLMDEAQPNAFATGRNPENAAVAVTTGLVHALSREAERDHRAAAATDQIADPHEQRRESGQEKCRTKIAHCRVPTSRYGCPASGRDTAGGCARWAGASRRRGRAGTVTAADWPARGPRGKAGGAARTKSER